MNTHFRATREAVEELLTQETLTSNREIIVKVKKPDFLGDSMWDFRFDGKKLTAKVVDQPWLKEFHNGAVPLRAGDCLGTTVEESVTYGFDGEVVAQHHRIVKVHGVITGADTKQ